MKIQGLAIIFILIILPITIIIGEYASTQIEIFRLEDLYDSRLLTATHDALKAFQINTFNDTTSDISDSKISSIEASASAFYNSMQAGFGLQGYSIEELQMYIPALVYTMYDGYYIYSPYTNIAVIDEKEDNPGDDLDEDYVKTELKINLASQKNSYGFKPYVYYSCRYYIDPDNDFIINYSLDNYITVQGIVNGDAVYNSGYLVSIVNSPTEKENGLYKETIDGVDKYYYFGNEIKTETNLTENLVEADGSIKSYKFVKLNGTKYYLNEDDEYIFYLLGGNRAEQVRKQNDERLYNQYKEQIENNSNAINYYKNAYEFTKWVNSNLSNLKPEHAQITGTTEAIVTTSGTGEIFDNAHIEYAGSNFNLHRKEVIRYSIESNLSVAIANFNGYTNAGTNFQMPKLKETEWELLENEVSIISFLQGLNLGGKIYNGYTVVTNDKTEEVVKEERIYIATNDGYYHKINDKHLSADSFDDRTAVLGVFDLDYEIRKDIATGTSYVQRDGLGCYTSIVGQENVNNSYDSIYEYLSKTNKVSNTIKTLYYTALGRERSSTYKIEKASIIADVIDDMNPENNYATGLTPIVTDGLIRHLEANNADGYGSKLDSLEEEVWRDLSEHYHGVVHGNPLSTETYVAFDGVDDWVDLGSIKDDMESTNITLEATVQFLEGTPTDSHILSNHQSGGIALLLRDNKIGVSANINGTYEGAEIFSSHEIENNTKYNISAVYNGEYLRLYINGQQEVEARVVGTITNPNDDTVMAIGTNPSGKNADSQLAQMNVYSIRVYNRALSEDEIERNCESSKWIEITDVGTTPTQGQWSKNGITVTVTATTKHSSGIRTIYYRIGDSEEWKVANWTEESSINNGKTKVLSSKWNGVYNNEILYLKAIDNNGNESDIISIRLMNDTSDPTFSNIKIENITPTGYDVYVYDVKDDISGINRVQFITNGQEKNGTDLGNGTWYCRVNVSEYSYQYGNYNTFVHIYDNSTRVKSRGVTNINVPAPYLDIDLNVNGTTYDTYNGIMIGLKVGGTDLGYVSEYLVAQKLTTSYQIYGLELNGTKISYTQNGTIDSDKVVYNATLGKWVQKITISFTTMTFTVNNSSYGTVSPTSLIVVNNTTYTTNGNIFTLSDGRTVTATAKLDNVTFQKWTASGRTYTANFTQLEIVKNGLKMHYDGVNNTGSGHNNSVTTWKDLMGNYNGTIESGTWKNNALSFDGNNGEVLCGANSGSGEFSNGITVQMKITYYEDVSALFAYDYGALLENGGVLFSCKDGNIGVKIYYEDSDTGYNEINSGGNLLKNGNTYNIAFTQGGGYIRLYIDGVQVAQTTSNGALFSYNHDKHRIRLNGNRRNLFGIELESGNGDKVDYHSVQLYTRALTASEISQNYKATK